MKFVWYGSTSRQETCGSQSRLHSFRCTSQLYIPWWTYTHRDLVLSVHAWCNFEYDNAPNCCDFVYDNHPLANPETVVRDFNGPHEAFHGRVCTIEFNTRQPEGFRFDHFRQIVSDNGYAVGLTGMWIHRRMEMAAASLGATRQWSRFIVFLQRTTIIKKLSIVNLFLT